MLDVLTAAYDDFAFRQNKRCGGKAPASLMWMRISALVFKKDSPVHQELLRAGFQVVFHDWQSGNDRIVNDWSISIRQTKKNKIRVNMKEYLAGYIEAVIAGAESVGLLSSEFGQCDFSFDGFKGLPERGKNIFLIHLSWDNGYRKTRSATRLDEAEYDVHKEEVSIEIDGFGQETFIKISDVLEDVDYVNLDEE